MTDTQRQVLTVKARLVQDHPDVDTVADAYLGGFVNRLTAATIFVACGMRMKRCRRVTDQARSALRMVDRTGDHRARKYAQQLEQLCLELAARTTPPARRKRTTLKTEQ